MFFKYSSREGEASTELSNLPVHGLGVKGGVPFAVEGRLVQLLPVKTAQLPGESFCFGSSLGVRLLKPRDALHRAVGWSCRLCSQTQGCVAWGGRAKLNWPSLLGTPWGSPGTETLCLPRCLSLPSRTGALCQAAPAAPCLGRPGPVSLPPP